MGIVSVLTGQCPVLYHYKRPESLRNVAARRRADQGTAVPTVTRARSTSTEATQCGTRAGRGTTVIGYHAMNAGSDIASYHYASKVRSGQVSLSIRKAPTQCGRTGQAEEEGVHGL